MKKLKEELENFISSISPEEMKYNKNLREKVIHLQELMANCLPSKKREESSKVLKYLDPKALLKA